MATKPPQLVCTQHPAPPCPPLPYVGSWPGLPVRLSIHATYPLLNMRRSTPVCQGAIGCLPWKTISSSPHSPFSRRQFCHKRTAPRRWKAQGRPYSLVKYCKIVKHVIQILLIGSSRELFALRAVPARTCSFMLSLSLSIEASIMRWICQGSARPFVWTGRQSLFLRSPPSLPDDSR